MMRKQLPVVVEGLSLIIKERLLGLVTEFFQDFGDRVLVFRSAMV